MKDNVTCHYAVKIACVSLWQSSLPRSLSSFFIHSLTHSLSLTYTHTLSLRPSLPPSSSACDFYSCPYNAHCVSTDDEPMCVCDAFYEMNDRGDCIGECLCV